MRARLMLVVAALSIALSSCGRQPPSEPPPGVPDPDVSTAARPTVIRVTARYPGHPARVLADAVAAFVEARVANIDGVTELESESDDDGGYNLAVRFKPRIDADRAKAEVARRVAEAQGSLPDAVRRTGLTVEAADSGAGALWVAVTSAGDIAHDEKALGAIAQRVVAATLARVPGVGQVKVYGHCPTGALDVALDARRLRKYDVAEAEVTAAIRANCPRSEVTRRRVRDRFPPADRDAIRLRVIGDCGPVEDLDGLTVKTVNDVPIKLREVGRVADSTDGLGFATLNGAPAALVKVPVGDGAAVRKALANLAGLPPGVRVTPVLDTAADSHVRGTVELPRRASPEETRRVVSVLENDVRRLHGVQTVVSFNDGRVANEATLLVTREDDGPTAADLDKVARLLPGFWFSASAHVAGKPRPPVSRWAILDTAALGSKVLGEAAEKLRRRLRADPNVTAVAGHRDPAGEILTRVNRHPAVILTVHSAAGKPTAEAVGPCVTAAAREFPKGIKVVALTGPTD